MKINKIFFLIPALMIALAFTARGALPVISSLDQNGVLVCANLEPGSVATVLEAATVTGPWTTNAGVVSVTSNGTFQLSGLVSPAGAKFYRVRGVPRAFNSAPTNMALIPAGSFTMGDSFGDGDASELPLHLVSVSAFYMDPYEVTKALWDEVYQWATNHGYSFDNAGSGKAASHPVQTINWYDAVKWCNARSEKEGRTCAYCTDAGLTQVYKTGRVPPYVNWNFGYRLPTEAEWEKAARGGASGHRFAWSDVETITQSQANYWSYWVDDGTGTNLVPKYAYDVNATNGYHLTYMTNGTPYTNPVGDFAANGYGLYDMVGNVWEWCWDWYGDTYYSAPPEADPRGPTTGSNRMLRGGSWSDGASNCRTARRNNRTPVTKLNSFGLRTVLPSSQP